MSKIILITGATDGIGLATAKLLFSVGHTILLHGRNSTKLAQAKTALLEMGETHEDKQRVATYKADFSNLAEVAEMARSVSQEYEQIDVLINNAGVFRTSHPMTSDGLDVRFVVNTLAPYLLTQRLLPIMNPKGRVINLSSAAQAPVNPDAMSGQVQLSDEMAAYAQSKLAITMWSKGLADQLGSAGPIVVAVNPGSLLATKMVKEGFGVPGKSIGIGADILARAAIADEFESSTGLYFDNDSGRFAPAHPDMQDPNKVNALIEAIEALIEKLM